jgi:hypothetical protein
MRAVHAAGMGLAALALAGCLLDDVALAGRQCPCVAPYLCDPARNQCVRALPASDAAADAHIVADAPIADATPSDGGCDAGTCVVMSCLAASGQFCSLTVPEHTVTGSGTCASGVCYHCDNQSETRSDLCVPRPAAEWPFDDATGAVAHDSTGNGNDGTISGATFSTGKLGGALAFDGDDDIVETNATILSGLGALTITAWVFPTAAGGYIATNHYACVSWESVMLGASTFIINSSDNETTRQELDFPPLPVGQWTHLTAKWTGTQLLVYQNGALVAGPSAAPNPPYDSTAALTLGALLQTLDCWAPGTGTIAGEFTGKLDDVRVYRRALSDTEIASLADPTAG